MPEKRGEGKSIPLDVGNEHPLRHHSRSLRNHRRPERGQEEADWPDFPQDVSSAAEGGFSSEK